MQRSPAPRMTAATQAVLRALIADPTRAMYGLEVGRAAGLASGTIHPILARLEGCGWVESSWEDLGEASVGRPRRRYYRITPDGVVAAARALDRAAVRATARPAGVVVPRWRPDLVDGGT